MRGDAQARRGEVRGGWQRRCGDGAARLPLREDELVQLDVLKVGRLGMQR